MAETSDLAIAFPARLPTTDEMVEFDRAVQGDDDYPSWYRTGDVVLLAVGDDSDRVALADALERTGFCDMAHVVSDGVYLEE